MDKLRNFTCYLKLLLGALFTIAFTYPVQAQLFINEISICNVNKELDPNYDYSGWIEIYNSSDNDVDLKNVYFSDEEDNPLKYKLSSSRIVPAKGYEVVWLNDEIKNSTTGYFLDTDADDGGFLSIADKNGNIYDTFTYEHQYTNVSYGRSIDGDIEAPLVYFLTSSFRATNNGTVAATEVVNTPVLSQTSGFYDTSIKVTISCKTKDAQIYYTTDSSEPTKESHLYTGEITIDKTTVLSARAFKDCYLEGLITSGTYLINERKPESLPIVFLTTSSDNLYDDMLGIYCIGTNGIILISGTPKANYNRDWTRWAHFEMVDENRDIHINQPIGLGISGNGSRGYDQKSFKIKGKIRFGKKRFDYLLFPTKEGLRHKSFVLRSGGQYYNSVQLIHDACIQSLADVTPLDYQASTPAVVYLNGNYWGIYNLRERKNKDMVYSHYGLSETDVDIIEYAWRPLAATGNKDNWNKLDDFVRNNDLTDDGNYKQVCDMMDIDNFLYYMAIELLVENSDWPNNNQQIFCPHREGGKWRWVLQDLDKTLGGTTSVNKLKELIESTSTLLSTKLIVYLLENEKFKEDYITVQSLVAGSVYAPKRFEARLIEMKKAIEAEYPYYQEKWPEQGKSDLEKTTNSKIKIEAQYTEQAFNYLRENFSLGNVHSLTISGSHDNVPLLFNGRQIPVLPYDGKWFEGKTLELKAPLYDKLKKFVAWEITSGSSTRTVATTTLELLLTEDTQVKAIYEKVDMARRAGLYINEVSADNATYVDDKYKYEDWVEIYNSSNNPVDLSGYYFSNSKDDLSMFRFSDEDKTQTVVPANGYAIIWCSKKPERGPLHTNFKLPKDGGTIYLSKEDEGGFISVEDSICYPEHDETVSFGRYPDGSETFVTFAVPTFKSMNLYSPYNLPGYTEEYTLVTDIASAPLADKLQPIVYRDSENQLYVKCPESVSMQVLSVNGQICEQGRSLKNEFYLNIGEYSSGVYLLVLESEHERWVYKFMK